MRFRNSDAKIDNTCSRKRNTVFCLWPVRSSALTFGRNFPALSKNNETQTFVFAFFRADFLVVFWRLEKIQSNNGHMYFIKSYQKQRHRIFGLLYISNNLHKYSEQTPQTQNINKLSAVIRSLDPLHGVVENFQRTAS